MEESLLSTERLQLVSTLPTISVYGPSSEAWVRLITSRCLVPLTMACMRSSVLICSSFKYHLTEVTSGTETLHSRIALVPSSTLTSFRGVITSTPAKPHRDTHKQNSYEYEFCFKCLFTKVPYLPGQRTHKTMEAALTIDRDAPSGGQSEGWNGEGVIPSVLFRHVFNEQHV